MGMDGCGHEGIHFAVWTNMIKKEYRHQRDPRSHARKIVSFQSAGPAGQTWGSERRVRKKQLAGQRGPTRDVTRISPVMTRPDP